MKAYSLLWQFIEISILAEVFPSCCAAREITGGACASGTSRPPPPKLLGELPKLRFTHELG